MLFKSRAALLMLLQNGATVAAWVLAIVATLNRPGIRAAVLLALTAMRSHPSKCPHRGMIVVKRLVGSERK